MNDQPEQPTEPKTKKAKPPSRSDRWAEAATDAREAINSILVLVSHLEDAVAELKSVQEEYEEWRDNLPDNLRTSPVGEKLDAVCDLDVESVGENVRSVIDDADSIISDAENMELPQGFGRD